MILGLLIIPLLLVSLAFSTLAVLGLYRFPDFYTRIHGVALIQTFGVLFAVAALLFYSAVSYLAGYGDRFLVLFIHSLLAVIVHIITNPTGAHAIARAAHRSGIRPEPAIIDALADAEKEKKKREGGAEA